jgi:hypothetical protein
VNREARWLMLSLRGVRLGSARLMQLLGRTVNVLVSSCMRIHVTERGIVREVG